MNAHLLSRSTGKGVTGELNVDTKVARRPQHPQIVEKTSTNCSAKNTASRFGRRALSLFSVTMVWLGFPMIITGAMTGSLLVLGVGFKRSSP